MSNYQRDMIAYISDRVSDSSLMVFNPPAEGLRDSHYDELKYQRVYKLQYLIRHE